MTGLRRIWLAATLGGLAVVIGCTLLLIVTGRPMDSTIGRVLGMASVTPFAGTFGLIATGAMRRGAPRAFMIPSMLATVAAAVMWMVSVARASAIMNDPRHVTWFEIAGSLAVVGPGLAVLGAAVTASRRGRWRPVLLRIATIAGIVAAFCGLGLTWSPLAQRFVETPLILGGVALATTLVAGVAYLVAVRVAALRETHRRESLAATTPVELTCPACSHHAPRPPGLSRCEACTAPLIIELEEPRCECGYLIYRLDRDMCPECGRAIQRGEKRRNVETSKRRNP